jgi:TP901 family phage tail tape measure protein
MGRNPKAVAEVSAETRGIGPALRAARADFSKFGGFLRREVFGKDLIDKGFASKAGAQIIGNLGSQALSAAGSFLVDQGKDVLDFQDHLKRLEILANSTPEAMQRFGSSVRKTSAEVGIGADKILEGAESYVALTGDIDGAVASSRTFARVAQATNSEVKDIAGTAAALKQQMDIRPENMERAFSALATQGKLGAIELKDLASQLSTIAPQWAQFAGGRGVHGVQQLGAALQIVKRGFGGDAGETITGMQSLLTSFTKHAPQLQKFGIKVFDKDPKTGEKTMRNVLDIVDSISNSKLVKDPTKLIKALGRVEAYRALIQLRENREELDKMVDASDDARVIQRDLDNYLQSSAGRTKVAWQKAKNEIAETFTPERIEQFTSLVVTGTKALAAMAGAASSVLSGVEGAAQLLARVIGGRSEDERAADAQKKHHDDRVKTVMERLSREGKLDPRAAEALRLSDMGSAMPYEVRRRALERAKKYGGASATDIVEREDAQTRGIAKGSWSRDELVGMRDYYAKNGGGMTNQAAILGLITSLIQKLDQNQRDMLMRFGDVFAKMNLTIGVQPDTFAGGVRTAPQNSRRPGE